MNNVGEASYYILVFENYETTELLDISLHIIDTIANDVYTYDYFDRYFDVITNKYPKAGVLMTPILSDKYGNNSRTKRGGFYKVYDWRLK